MNKLTKTIMWIGWTVAFIPSLVFLIQGFVLTLSFGRLHLFKDFFFKVIESDGIPLPLPFYFYIVGIWILLVDIILVFIFDKFKNE